LIRVNDLSAEAILGTGASWPLKPGREGALQQISVSLAVPHDVRTTAETDDLKFSINYSELASQVRKTVAPPAIFSTLNDLANSVHEKLLDNDGVSSVWLRIVQHKGPVHGTHVGLELSTTRNYRWFIQDLDCHAIVGVNDSEREETQNVVLNISIENAQPVNVDFRHLVRYLYKVGRQLRFYPSNNADFPKDCIRNKLLDLGGAGLFCGRANARHVG
jgi:dihydroneopterin aldolase / 2-amino-4-hydroxy-6-hydroxymethyldihydropteridine diphosphokinase / dihydropteroate synthase